MIKKPRYNIVFISIILLVYLFFSGCINNNGDKDINNNSNEVTIHYNELVIEITMSIEHDYFIYVPVPTYQDVNYTEHPSQIAYNITSENPNCEMILTEQGLVFNISTNKENVYLSSKIKWSDKDISNEESPKPLFAHPFSPESLSLSVNNSYLGSKFYVYSNSTSDLYLSYRCKTYNLLDEETENSRFEDVRNSWIIENVKIEQGWNIVIMDEIY